MKHNVTSRADELRLAAHVPCDPRTARIVLEKGPEAVRSLILRERIVRSLRELGLADAPVAITGERTDRA